MSLLHNFNVSQDNVKTVLEILTNAKQGFQICHLNARSLTRSKIEFLNYVLPQNGPDMLAVSETWFKTDVDDRFYELQKYKLFRHDRQTDSRGGGVAFYIRNNLQTRIVLKSSIDEPVEYIGVELSAHDKSKCLCICVYNPSRTNNLCSLFEKLVEIFLHYEKIIVCGDFNINILSDDMKSTAFKDSVASCGLNIINTLPTRYGPNCSPALLDLVLCSNKSLTIHFDQLSLGGLSDHDMLFYVCDFNLETKLDDEIIYHDFNAINMEHLYNDCLLIEWNQIWWVPDVNAKIEHFNNVILHLFHKFVPRKVKKQRKIKPPWYNSLVKDFIKQRNKLYITWKENPSAQNWSIFKAARNKSHAVTKKAKCEYYRRMFGSSDLTTKTLWKKLETMGVKKKKQSCQLPANDMNQYFLQSSQPLIDRAPQLNAEFVYDGPRLNFSAFGESDVLLALKSIKSDAVGHDGIHLKFLKMLLPFILSPITHIFNHIITTSVFPSTWKIGNIIPVNKKSSPCSPNDFRPVTILSGLSKAFEKLLAVQINKHIAENNLLSPEQSGFQTGKSCNTATLKVIEDLRPAFDRGELSIIVLIDFSKAFDMVDFNILTHKLFEYFGFSILSINLLKSYLSNRLQYVTTSTGVSSLSAISSGVPQGSILGPILFSMFINDMVGCCKNTSIHLYADDAQIYMSRPVGLKEDLGERINDDLRLICKWADTNRLLINTSKTQAICLHHTSASKEDYPLIYMQSTAIEYAEVVKSLGFQINTRLNCIHHINCTVQKIYNILRMLWFSSSFLQPYIKLNLIHSLILPLIMYAANVYGDLDAASLRKLQLAVNNCTRFVYKKRKYDHISHLSHNILGFSIKNFLNFRNILFIHKLINSKTPAYLYSKLKLCQSNRTNNLVLPKCKFQSTSRMFFVNAIKLWNSLPIHLKNELNYVRFKCSITELLNT